jgi:hypothetical protein
VRMRVRLAALAADRFFRPRRRTRPLGLACDEDGQPGGHQRSEHPAVACVQRHARKRNSDAITSDGASSSIRRARCSQKMAVFRAGCHLHLHNCQRLAATRRQIASTKAWRFCPSRVARSTPFENTVPESVLAFRRTARDARALCSASIERDLAHPLRVLHGAPTCNMENSVHHSEPQRFYMETSKLRPMRRPACQFEYVVRGSFLARNLYLRAERERPRCSRGEWSMFSERRAMTPRVTKVNVMRSELSRSARSSAESPELVNVGSRARIERCHFHPTRNRER